jgi:hypothetical protein
MASPITNLDLSQSLLLRGLSLPNKMAMVYAQDYGYNVLTQLTSKLAPSISSNQAKIEISALGNFSVYSRVAAAPTTPTGYAVGEALLLTLDDASNFRVGDIIADANLVQGIVVDKPSGGGQLVVIKRVSTTFSTAAHFQSGTIAKVFFDSSANRYSNGKTPLSIVPQTDYTYTAITRESSSQARRDRIASFVKWQGDFWYRSYDDLALRKFSKSLEFKYAFSERAIVAGPQGEAYTTGGLRWSIINNGGTYLPMTTEFTQSQFNDFLETLVRKSAENGRNLVALMGTAAMARLQTLLSPYIQYGGSQNTLGGVSVEGLNVMTYSYAGMKIDFVRWALLDDDAFKGDLSSVTGKPRMSHSIYVVDLTAIPAADGSGNLAPLQKYHFNNDELLAAYVPGLIGLQDSNPSSVKQALANGLSGSLSSSDVDGVDFHILSDCGLYCASERMGLIELIA